MVNISLLVCLLYIIVKFLSIFCLPRRRYLVNVNLFNFTKFPSHLIFPGGGAFSNLASLCHTPVAYLADSRWVGKWARHCVILRATQHVKMCFPSCPLLSEQLTYPWWVEVLSIPSVQNSWDDQFTELHAARNHTCLTTLFELWHEAPWPQSWENTIPFWSKNC